MVHYTLALHGMLHIKTNSGWGSLKQYLRDVKGARDEMPEPSVWEQPDMLRVESPVSSDRGARSALRRMPWQCCSFSAVSPVRLPSGCSLHGRRMSETEHLLLDSGLYYRTVLMTVHACLGAATEVPIGTNTQHGIAECLKGPRQTNP